MNSALLIVDVQKDFMPGGALEVPKGYEVIPKINAMIPCFSCVIATKDFHPKGHISFASSHQGKGVGDTIEVHGLAQKLWPEHCLQDDSGSMLDSRLALPANLHTVYKGKNIEVDSYSAFFDNAKKQSTGLDKLLEKMQVSELFICGVATDYCVLYTVLDALDLGYKVYVIADACRGIDCPAGEVAKAFDTMKRNGAIIISSTDVESFV